jgi:hypothetical protein
VALWQVDLDGDGSDEVIAVLNYLDGIGGGAIALVSATDGGGLRSFVLCRTTEFFPTLVGLMETKGTVALSVVLSDDEGTQVFALQRERPVPAQPGHCVQ